MTQMVAVVKAQAYGSATLPFVRRLVQLGVDALAVAYTEEGVELREAGIDLPILVFYPQADTLEALLDAHLEPCLYSRSLVNRFKVLLQQKQQQHYPVHIKYNTGLHRVGFNTTDTAWILEAMELEYFQLRSVYSHLAASEAPRPCSLCDDQIMQFEKLKTAYQKACDPPPKFHLLNSSGVFNYPEHQYGMVRCGIALHGFANRPEWDALLKPIASLSTQICQLHHVQKGSYVGYDHGWQAPQDSVIATLPLGHADGIGRHYGHGRGSVEINGQSALIVGNVCMDMLMVNVTNIACKEGDKVLFFGGQSTAADFAKSANSISYELLTGLGSRIQRVIEE